jgi:hypothetical protein
MVTYLCDTIQEKVSGERKMNLRHLFVTALLLGFAAVAVSADVYVWTDENGVKHYSNVAPSEKADEIDKDKELRTNSAPGAGTQPTRRERRSSQSAAPSRSQTAATPRPSGPDGDATEEDPDSAADGHSTGRLDLKKFPIPQDQLVTREKAIVSQLKRNLEKSDADREALISREKKRLMQSIVDLESASLAKFGSQKNKLRQVGYYKYRLEALMNSPETYFDYGESDAD